MARFSGPPGTSLWNPIIIHSSAQSQPSSSQVDQLQSSSQASTQLTSASSARVPEPAPATSTAPRFHWTQQNEYDLVKAIKDNVDYQTVLLPGHVKDDVKNDGDAETTGTKPLSKASIYRTISSQIFRQHEQKTPAQMRQKPIGLLETYRTLIKNESRTGQGLLLSDMREGSIKTQREQYLERHPWYEMMHEMMLDREDSDTDIVVTGSGERRLRPEDDEDVSRDLHDAGNDEKGQSDENADNDEYMVGKSQYSQALARGLAAGLYDDDLMDDDDDQDDMGSIDPRLRQNSSRSQDAGTGSSSSLPSLEDLASQSGSDRQRHGAVSASSYGLGTSARDRSPVPSTFASFSRSKAELTSKGKSKAKGRDSQSDAYIAQFSRNMDEDRRLQLEREETKRRKLDVRSQQIIMQSQERERQSDLINTQLVSVFNLIDAMQVSMTARMDGLNGVLTGVMARLDSLSAKLDRAFHR
ncbi:hypothetical protein V8E36_006749 [Tilletia maclaganii]